VSGISINPEAVKTDIVYFETTRSGIDAKTLVGRLAEEGVRVLPTGPRQIRAVTNYHVTTEDIDYMLSKVGKIMGAF
jgi:threonine aldolase